MHIFHNDEHRDAHEAVCLFWLLGVKAPTERVPATIIYFHNHTSHLRNIGWSAFVDRLCNKVVNADGEHKAKLSHQLIAAAASYEAAKAYQDHLKKNGKPTSHEKAKEIFAGFAGLAVDRLIETKGLDAIDKYKAKKHASERADVEITETNYHYGA